MAINSTLFVRVVAQDRQRGFALLVGFDGSKLVQSTADRVVSMSGLLTREHLNNAIARVKGDYPSASEVRDITAEGIKRQLIKLFGETAAKEPKVALTDSQPEISSS